MNSADIVEHTICMVYYNSPETQQTPDEGTIADTFGAPTEAVTTLAYAQPPRPRTDELAARVPLKLEPQKIGPSMKLEPIPLAGAEIPAEAGGILWLAKDGDLIPYGIVPVPPFDERHAQEVVLVNLLRVENSGGTQKPVRKVPLIIPGATGRDLAGGLASQARTYLDIAGRMNFSVNYEPYETAVPEGMNPMDVPRYASRPVLKIPPSSGVKVAFTQFDLSEEITGHRDEEGELHSGTPFYVGTRGGVKVDTLVLQQRFNFAEQHLLAWIQTPEHYTERSTPTELLQVGAQLILEQKV